MGHKNSIFIFNKTNNTKNSVDFNRISKISDIFNFIKDDSKREDISGDYNLVLMCDIAHINLEDLIMNKEDMIIRLKKYIFLTIKILMKEVIF